jgi:hypothetical protein
MRHAALFCWFFSLHLYEYGGNIRARATSFVITGIHGRVPRRFCEVCKLGSGIGTAVWDGIWSGPSTGADVWYHYRNVLLWSA